MPNIPCRYCGQKISSKEMLRLSEHPAQAVWYTAHYSKCTGLIKYLRCICDDLRHRFKCDACKTCMKTANPNCKSKDHPKTEDDLIEIFSRENLCTDDSSPRTLRRQLLETLEPLENVVKTYDRSVDSEPDLKIL